MIYGMCFRMKSEKKTYKKRKLCCKSIGIIIQICKFIVSQPREYNPTSDFRLLQDDFVCVCLGFVHKLGHGLEGI